MSEIMPTLEDRWKSICHYIVSAQVSPAASKKPVTLIAVSKTHSAEAILPLLELGLRDFGENRVQEAQAKWPALRERYPDIRLHLIGSLQSNKMKEALSLFEVIHSVDRESLVDALAKARGEGQGVRCEEFFVQVNIGEEPQKAGVAPGQVAALLEYCQARGLAVSGLMCVPPANEPPAPYFALLRTLADRSRIPSLSMGMSGDYATAVRLGATHVRIGTALMGERETV
jgi:pyridoxal phosphate enzyme (YggS family)